MGLEMQRAAGILLHLTSLPSAYGIGELGRAAFDFVDFLAAGGQKLWQILPLNPVGYGDSPYQCFSAFAGNHLLISLEKLGAEGLLAEDELAWTPGFPTDKVDFRLVRLYKDSLLRKAFYRFFARVAGSGCRETDYGNADYKKSDYGKSHYEISDYQEYVEGNSYWLSDFALFMSLKELFSGRPWNEWDRQIALREKSALQYYEELLKTEIEYHLFLQYKFQCQWRDLREYARQKDVMIIGDMPIFISYDSSDTWVNPHLFMLDAQGYPDKVAGVPPDYFSETGQLWGNPHYRWDVMAQDDYLWWRQRFMKLLEWVDVIRIDHFRGFEAYWEIDAAEDTAVNGRWVKGPGRGFFTVLEKYLGKIPVIAEDLGFITPEVHRLRDSLGFPGMKVLQFTAQESLVPGPAAVNTIYYTGTHDNDTLLGWYEDTVLKGLCSDLDSLDKETICWDFIETVYRSQDKWVIVPLQDILCLGSRNRMNTPGTVGGNWQWCCSPGSLNGNIARRLAALAEAWER